MQPGPRGASSRGGRFPGMSTRSPILAILAILVALACTPEVAAPADPQPAPQPKPKPAQATQVTVDADGWETPADEAPALPEALRPQPPGFGPDDAYSSHDEACLAVVQLEVPDDEPAWRRAILAWCEHRNYHASRNRRVESKVDGSQVHDRDRPTAWIFYEKAVVDGTLDPDGCPFHGINRRLKHPPACHRLRKNWPFKHPPLDPKSKTATEWRMHPHDMERFGARGPHDWNANAYRHLPGCWDPAQLERFDVGVTVTVRASLKICERWGCTTKADIKAHWGRRASPPKR